MFVCYEKLVIKLEEVLINICWLLGIEFFFDMIEFWK